METFPIDKMDEVVSTCEKVGSMIYEKDNDVLGRIIQIKESFKEKLVQLCEDLFGKIEKDFSERGKFQKFSEKMDLVNDLKNEFDMDRTNKEIKVKLVDALRRLTHLHKEGLLAYGDLGSVLTTSFRDFESKFMNTFKAQLESNINQIFTMRLMSQNEHHLRNKELFARVSTPSEHLKTKNIDPVRVFERNNKFNMKMPALISQSNSRQNAKEIVSNSENLKKDEQKEVFVQVCENNREMKDFFEELTKFKPIQRKYLSFIQYIQDLESETRHSTTRILHSGSEFLLGYTQPLETLNFQNSNFRQTHVVDVHANNPRFQPHNIPRFQPHNYPGFQPPNSENKKKRSCLSLVSGLDSGEIHKEVLELDYYVESSFLSKKGELLLVTSSDTQFYLYDIVRSDGHGVATPPKLKENEEFNRILKNCLKAEFVPHQHKKTLLYVSENNEFTSCDLESGSVNPLSLENDVVEFVCLNQNDILVLKKDLEIKVFNFKSKEFKEQSSYDPHQIKRFLSTLIYDKRYFESNASLTPTH
jgi:hypothetical protein